MEEDTARNTHALAGGQSGIDFNRSGVALLEIVTEPDIRSADEAFAYLNEQNIALARAAARGVMPAFVAEVPEVEMVLDLRGEEKLALPAA